MWFSDVPILLPPRTCSNRIQIWYDFYHEDIHGNRTNNYSDYDFVSFTYCRSYRFQICVPFIWQRYTLYLQFKKTGANLDAYVGACRISIPIDVECWPIVDLDSLGSVTLALCRSNSFSDSEPLTRLESQFVVKTSMFVRHENGDFE